MEWDTDQFSRLFKMMYRKVWLGDLFYCPLPSEHNMCDPDHMILWRKYLGDLSIRSSESSASSWEELCHDPSMIEMNIVDKAFLAAHDQENLFMTDPANDRSTIFPAEGWIADPSVHLKPPEGRDLVMAHLAFVKEKRLALLGRRSPPQYPGGMLKPVGKIGGEFLIIPKDTAENILVLGLP